MNVTVRIPDDLAERLGAADGDLERRALEALALAEYRAGRLTRAELGRMLGLASSSGLDAFLKVHGLDAGGTAAESDSGSQQAGAQRWRRSSGRSAGAGHWAGSIPAR
jgi:hypothetical protein